MAAISLTCAIFVASASASALGPQEFAVYGTSGSQTGVWTADPGGGSIHYLGTGTHPSLSSDGLEVAYSREKCLALAAVSGGTPLEMICDYTLPPRDVEWNSYGDAIAFAGDLNHKGYGVFYRMRDLSGVTVHLVDWPSDQFSPTWAPSGKLAFISAVNAAGSSVGGNQLWIKQGSGFNENIYQLTGVGGAFAGPVQNAAWSPDGKYIAVNAYHKTQGGKDPEAIGLINASNGIVEQWLLDKDGEYNTNPQWTPDGKNIAFTAESSSHTNRRIEMITIAGTNRHQVVSSLSPSEWVSFQRGRSGAPLDYNNLLYRYAPQLRYDIQEQYFADSAAEATDNPSNRIMALDRETVLAAHAEGFTTPSLKLLEEPAFQSSYIDEGPEYAEDAALLHANEAYGNRIYGRVHQEPESGWTWLQYFFYYYYDSQDAVGIGVHEGDWETVAFRLDQNGVPDLAIYSRHGSESAACPATDVEWAPGWSGAAPIVYVANASHANYFEGGQKDRTFPLPNDEAHGDGAVIRPTLEQITDGVAEGGPLPVPGWFAWQGRWGSSWESGGIDQESPQSPAIQKKRWEELPQFMADSVLNCDNGETGGAQPLRAAETQLAAPAVSGRRQGGSILVHYRVPPPEKHRKLLYLTVTSAKEKDATRSKTLPLKRDTGTVRLPLPLAPGPYIATASTLDGNGERSDVDTAPVEP